MSAREELEQLDYEFNRVGATMLLTVYQQRRTEFVAKLEDEQRVARIEAAKNPPPPRRVPTAPHNPKRNRMSAADRAELKAFEKRFDEGQAASDIGGMFALFQDKKFSELLLKEGSEIEGELSPGSVASLLYAMIKELHLVARIAHVQREQLEKRIRDIEPRLEAELDDYLRTLQSEREEYMRAANSCLADVSAQYDQYAAFFEGLPARLEAVEERSGGISYRGVFDARERYARADFCTWDGSMWFAKRDNMNEPPSYQHDGTSPWQLAVKKGRPAKEA